MELEQYMITVLRTAYRQLPTSETHLLQDGLCTLAT